MKKLILIAALLIAMTTLAACGNKDNGGAQDVAATQRTSGGAQAEAAVAGDPIPTVEEAGAQGDSEEGTPAATDEPTLASADDSRPIDLDLTRLSGTVVYSQVYDMMANPDGYMGQKIRMKGSFSYFQNPDTKQEYFAAIIADATACCAQGIEFVWKGEHSYPNDYPPLGAEITVTGDFSTYYEGDYMYIQLADAQVEWATE